MENKDNIELRSEKVRHIIGRIPPLLIRMGTAVVAIIMIAMSVAVYTVHYPITIEAKGEVVTLNTIPQARVYIPYKYIGLFDEQRTADIKFEGYDKVYVMPVILHSHKLIPIDGVNYFETRIKLSENDLPDILIQHMQKVNVRILISDRTIWQLLGF